MHRLGTLGVPNGVVGAILAAGLRRREGGIVLLGWSQTPSDHIRGQRPVTTRWLWAVRGAEGQVPNQPF